MRNVTLYASAGINVAAAGNTPALDVSSYETVKFYANLTALSGGTTPSVQFFYQEADDFGTWYDVAQLGVAITAVGTQTTSVGEGAKVNEMVGKSGRVRWAVTGAPATATATLTVVADEDE